MKKSIFCILFLTIVGITLTSSRAESNTIEINNTDTSGVLVTSDGSKLPYLIEGQGFPCIVVNDPLAMPELLSEELRNHFQFIFRFINE